jgi:hypothetical protein
MSTLILGSAKGSPGVTTTTLALSFWWQHPLIVIEADHAGGDLAVRLGMSEEPGLVGLAAAIRRSPIGNQQVSELIAQYAQTTPFGKQVVLAPAGSAQATSALSLLAESVSLSPPQGPDLLVDIGRSAGSATPNGEVGPSQTWGWIGAPSDVVIWICRPDLADLAHLAARLHHQRVSDQVQVIVLVGAGVYPPAEIATTLGVPVIGHLPIDRSGAAALCAGGGRAWTRSPLGRGSKALAGTISAFLGSHAPEAGDPEGHTERIEHNDPYVSESAGDAC